MSKLLALATALALAVVTTMSTAQAGNNGVRLGIGLGVGALAIGAIANSAQRSEAREYRERKKTRAVRREREEKAPVRSAKRSKPEKAQEIQEAAYEEPAVDTITEASSIAGADDVVAPEVITGSTEVADQNNENSSIALTSIDEPAPAAGKSKSLETASQKSLDCKKFFPSVGMTLSVPCE
jgi:hypothetical protein